MFFIRTLDHVNYRIFSGGVYDPDYLTLETNFVLSPIVKC